jgi:hypothetical protein
MPGVYLLRKICAAENNLTLYQNPTRACSFALYAFAGGKLTAKFRRYCTTQVFETHVLVNENPVWWDRRNKIQIMATSGKSFSGRGRSKSRHAS